MKKIKRILVLVCAMTLMLCFLTLAACNKKVDKLVSENGMQISGDGLEKDVEFIVEEITDEKRKEELQTPLSELAYDKDIGVVIYKIELEKNGAHFHIETPLTVTLDVPMPGVKDYVVFHIKENGSIATIYPKRQDNGTLSFEIKSMGYLILGRALQSSEISHRLNLITVVEENGTEAVLKNGQQTVYSSDPTKELGKKEAYSLLLLSGNKATVSTSCESENAQFVGWFRVLSEKEDDASGDRLSRLTLEEKPFSTDPKAVFEFDKMIQQGAKSTYCAVWKAKRTLEVDMDSLLPKNAEGKYVYNTSDPTPDFDRLVARSVNLLTSKGETFTAGNGYTIEKNSLDITKAGEYTLTYILDADPTVRHSFKIVVVESPVLTVHSGKGGGVIYKDQIREDIFVDILPSGSEVKLVAYPSENYRFLGWYIGDSLLSKELIYSFSITGTVAITPKFEEWNLHKFEFGVQTEGDADASILKDGSVVANISGKLSHTEMLREGERVTLTASAANENLQFTGWYIKNGTTLTLVSTDATYTFIAPDANISYCAVFKAKHEMRVEINAADLHLTYSEESGRYLYQIGDQAPAFENVKAEMVNLLTGEVTALENFLGYLVDPGDFNANAVGVYTVHYICIQDPSATMSIQVEVVAKSA